MDTYPLCPECITQNTTNTKITKEFVPDNEFISVDCEQGHSSVVLNQEFKFESLFYEGLRYYAQRDYSTAIMKFATSLDQFYNFCTLMMARAAIQDDNYVDNDFFKSLKYTEQKMGAFCALYQSMFREKPPLLKTNTIKIRNDAAHQGNSMKEPKLCLDYAEPVMKIITETIAKFQSQYPEVLKYEIEHHLSKQYDQIKDPEKTTLGVQTGPVSFTTLYDFSGLTIPMLAEEVRLFESLSESKMAHQKA